MAGLAFGITFLYVQYRFNLKILGVFATVVLSALMLAVVILPDTPVAPDKILKGVWFVAHIIFIFVGEAALGLAAGAGILYLIQEQGIKGKKPGFFFRRLPSLDFLDQVSYTCITTGFALLTFGWSRALSMPTPSGGRFWSWDFKEIFSVGTWLVYATLLHLRLSSGWRGHRSAVMSIAGFAIIIFTFLGVNLILGGHHQALPNREVNSHMSQIILIGANHKTAPVELREKLAFSQEETLGALEFLKAHPGIREGLVFSTCNRMELLYIPETGDQVEEMIQFISDHKSLPASEFRSALYIHRGDEAIRHLFSVAASLDSMVVGEPQILGQVKLAYKTAVDAGGSGVLLNRLMHKSFSVAKRVRKETGIGDNAVSISYAPRNWPPKFSAICLPKA